MYIATNIALGIAVDIALESQPSIVHVAVCLCFFPAAMPLEGWDAQKIGEKRWQNTMPTAMVEPKSGD